ncbi:HAMP domain-containing histidine kinase [Thiorhodococcus mannitoliphagus]|uniref:histidine kinase n=2 Tax=Thiorhodococcus mannitoliphagus TaxID=329406 RepID=A0A6P1DLI9_9GAMM|nr:HAMP domain-containing sensor histidine kinase [Thiorhodococcus mannitoliphagus]NEX18898.1 HAMP domain-containing histidine kinase [Thiorhodococcus mannitoliphagus]
MPPDSRAGAWAQLRTGAARILRSSTFRLALLYVLLLSVSVAILLGYIYWSTAGYMDRQTTATIQAEIRGLAEQYRRRGLGGLTALITERVARDPVGASVYLLVDSGLERVVGNLDRWPPESPDADGWIGFRLREWGPARTEEHEARAQVFALRGGLRLLVGRDVRDLEATRALILDALTWGLAITAALALLGGWLMSAGLVRRLESINQTSREIMAGDLSRRIPLSGSGDDFDQLAASLNAMLDRIEQLMASVRQVSDNIAHDLRTPLTRLRNKLELLSAELSASGKAIDLAEETIGDAEEMLSTFNALLRIARIESGSRRAAFAEVDLAPLVQDVVELYEPLAAERGQQLIYSSAGPGRVFGDRDLLFQALANLVDNAIKYTPAGGEIQILVDAEPGGGARVEVADDGPGIPAELRDQVFRRFFRADDSRSTPGSGLGLSLVQAVVQLHRASIELSDHQPGLRVILRLGAGQSVDEPVRKLPA